VKPSRLARIAYAILFAVFVLVQAGVTEPLAAQIDQPSMHAPARVENNEIGFSYSLPGEWEAVGATPALPAEQQEKEQKASSAEERQGIACIDIPLTAQRGKPASVIVVVALPFKCFGQTMGYEDLPAFGEGAAEGLKRTLDIAEPIAASYKLAGHRMWIQRSKATPKGKTAPEYTVEIACTVLEKGAVCWLAQAADAAGLEAFEHATVTLEGVDAGALVPKDVFVKNP
jgi:hypothetical protein